MRDIIAPPAIEVRRNCRDCVGCKHGRVVFQCGACAPCPHGKTRRNCAQCYGCIHGRLKYQCRDCRSSKPCAPRKSARRHQHMGDITIQWRLPCWVCPTVSESQRSSDRKKVIRRKSTLRQAPAHPKNNRVC